MLTFASAVFPPGSPTTITLTSSPLPNLDDDNVTVDATSTGVILNGSHLTGWENDLSLTSTMTATVTRTTTQTPYQVRLPLVLR